MVPFSTVQVLSGGAARRELAVIFARFVLFHNGLATWMQKNQSPQMHRHLRSSALLPNVFKWFPHPLRRRDRTYAEDQSDVHPTEFVRLFKESASGLISHEPTRRKSTCPFDIGLTNPTRTLSPTSRPRRQSPVSFDRRLEDPHARGFVSGSGDNGVESLPESDSRTNGCLSR